MSLGDDLTPPQLAYLQKLQRMHDTGSIDQRYNTAAAISGALMVLMFALSIMGFMGKWPTYAIWMFGLLAGVSEHFFIMSLKFKGIWPAMDRIIDWTRLKAITAATEKT